MVVNLKGDATSQNIHYLTDRVTFPVYQDTSSLNIWSILNGGKDDILVYDRCGQLTYHARLPYSNLQHNIVQRAIQYTWHGYDPCVCIPTTPKAPTFEPTTELLTEFLIKEDDETTQMKDLQTTQSSTVHIDEK